MKKELLSGLFVTTSLCLGLAGQARAEDIFEILSQTYNSNPTLQAERAYLRSIDENVAIAKSGYRPTVSLSGAYNDGHDNIKKASVPKAVIIH